MAGVFKLYRIGSDPEFAFSRTSDWTPTLVPAAEVISVTKKMSLESFIGMDSHTLGGNGQLQTTAELRPPPTRNIGLHLYYIAYGIDRVADYLSSRSRFKGVVPFALPILGKEALGGHIHISGFVPEPTLYTALNDYNLTFMNGKPVNFNKNNPTVPPTLSANAAQFYARFTTLALAGELTTPQLFERAMNYLILPFEYWMQPWAERTARFQLYDGTEGGNYFIRWLHTVPRHWPGGHAGEWAYLHMEYRTPSTWLIHPWLAYTYFALAKLSILNFKKIWERMLIASPMRLEGDDVAWNLMAREEFLRRLDELNSSGLVFSNDIKDLQRAINICGQSREAWFSNKAAGIDVQAWRSLL